MRQLRRLTIVAAAGLVGSFGLLDPTGGRAAPTDEAASAPRGDAEHEAAERLVRDRRFAEAIPLLERVVARDPVNADALSSLGFSQRKLGRFDEAFRSYGRALDLDPDHIEAREYLGELFVELGDLARAQAELEHLKRLCPLGCEPRDDLARAIAERSRR